MEHKNVSFYEFLKTPTNAAKKILININSVPPHMAGDYLRRNDNVIKDKNLCSNCDGTGNELMSMYRKCPVCNGIGIFRKTGGKHG